MKKLLVCASFALFAISALNAWTITILSPESLLNEPGNVMPGGSGMQGFAGMLSEQGATVSSQNLATFAVADADAVIVNVTGGGEVFTDTEMAVLAALVNSNTKVLLIGEHNGWSNSNQQLADLLGGQYLGGNGSNTQSAVTPSSETGKLILQDVTNITLGSPGRMEIGGGNGEWLSSGGSISLWGTEDNVLLSMDINMFSGSYFNQNTQLLQNIADFLHGATPIPEPSTWAFLIGGSALGLVTFARRRKISR